VLTVAVIVLGLHALSKPAPHPVKSASAVAGDATQAAIGNFSVQGLLAQSNAMRANNAKGALTLNSKLNASAKAKCNDMVAKNYWAHNAPSGTQPWTFFKSVGYAYTKAGENLAYGFSDNALVVTGWMNSPGHRANLLDGDFKEVGFGICESPNFDNKGHEIIVVQHLATPTATMISKPEQSAYKAPTCTKTAIPFETKTIEASYMYEGESQTYGGSEGYTTTCTADSNGYKPPDFTVQPSVKIIYVGNKPKPTADTTNQ
jgi:uncharacterized protein YkwD